MRIKIDDLDMSLQTRCGTDIDTIGNYAEAMSDGAQFPDVTVFTDGERYWLADGFHRVEAARRIGRTTVSADVRKGTEDDAVVFGGTANNKQGKRPTRADVQHFMEMVWERREAVFGGTPTGGNMAEKCGVSRSTATSFVNARLAEMQIAPVAAPVQIGQVKRPVRPTKLVGSDGKEYPVRPTRPMRPVRPSAPVAAPVPTPTRPRKSSDIEDWPRDRYGVQIPQELLGAFADETARDRIEAALRTAERMLREAYEGKDVSTAAVRQSDLMDLQNVVSAVKLAKPHCVCRMCQGNGCRACRMAGFQTKMQYEANPREFRAD